MNTKSIAQKAHELKKSLFWSGSTYSLKQRYYCVKNKEAIAEYFRKPIPEITGETDYIDIETPFSFVIGDRKFTVKIITEYDDFYSQQLGQYGEFVAEIPEGIYHSIELRHLIYHHNVHDSRDKYYIPSCYCENQHTRKKQTSYNPSGFYDTLRDYQRHYGKHDAFLRLIKDNQEEYDSLCDLMDGEITPTVVGVKITVNDTTHVIGSDYIGGVEVGTPRYTQSRHLDGEEQIEDIIREYDLIGEAYQQALETISTINTPVTA